MSIWDRLRPGTRQDTDAARCEKVRQVVQNYLDGELDDMETDRVRRHLEACRRCGLDAQTYRAVKRALSGMGREPDERALRRLHDFAEGLCDS